MLLEHGGDDRIRGADRFVPHIHRIPGLHIRQAVMIDNRHNLRLVQAGHGLSHFVMVHQHDPFPLGLQQVVPADGSDHFIRPVQDRVAAEPVL